MKIRYLIGVAALTAGCGLSDTPSTTPDDSSTVATAGSDATDIPRSSTGGPAGEGLDVSEDDVVTRPSALVGSGRVDERIASAGQVATLYTLPENGGELVARGSGEVQQDGSYELETEEDGSRDEGSTGASDYEGLSVIEIAEGMEVVGRAVFSAASDSEPMPMVTPETTAVAQVFLASATSVSQGDVERAFATGAAVGFLQDDAAAAVSALVHDESSAESEAMLDLGGATAAQLDAAGDAMLTAHAQLQAELRDARNSDEARAAFHAFAEAYDHAYAASGLDVSAVAIASHVEAMQREEASIELGAELAAAMRLDAELLRATRVTAAVEATLQAQGMLSTSIESVGDELENEMANAGVDADFAVMYRVYFTAVLRSIDAAIRDPEGTLEGNLDFVSDVVATNITSLADLAYDSADAVEGAGAVQALASLHASTTLDEAQLHALVDAGLEPDAARALLDVVFHFAATQTTVETP